MDATSLNKVNVLQVEIFEFQPPVFDSDPKWNTNEFTYYRRFSNGYWEAKDPEEGFWHAVDQQYYQVLNEEAKIARNLFLNQVSNH